MSTHSMISAKIGSKVKTIYCHYDGYPAWSGRILLEHYDTQEKVEALMELGWLSRLSESPDCPPGHTYGNPHDGYCVAYRRDRKEDLDKDYTKGEWFDSWDESMADRHEDYAYFWDGIQWWVSDGLAEPRPLSRAIELKKDSSLTNPT